MVKTERGHRVYFPGEEMPVGIWVCGRDGSVAEVEFMGTRVDPNQPYPLIEVLLPDFEKEYAEAYARRNHRVGYRDGGFCRS